MEKHKLQVNAARQQEELEERVGCHPDYIIKTRSVLDAIMTMTSLNQQGAHKITTKCVPCIMMPKPWDSHRDGTRMGGTLTKAGKFTSTTEAIYP